MVAGDPSSILSLIESQRLVAIIRLDDLSDAVDISRALLDGGIGLQEFTLTNPEALNALSDVRKKLEAFSTCEAALGVGSVRRLEQAQAAVAAGAQFIVTPTLNQRVIEYCASEKIPVMSGAYTPTEIALAWEWGASLVKVFPARNLGPEYIKDVLAPMPELKLMPTGGVDLGNMKAYFQAGAHAVGIGGNLLDKHAIASGHWNEVTQVARRYADAARRSPT